MRRTAAAGSLTFVIVASLSALGLAAAAAHGQAPAESPAGAWPPFQAASPDALAPEALATAGRGFEGWAFVKSGESTALMGQPAGTHHIYANAAARAGMASGDYADGAVLAFDVVLPSVGPGRAPQAGQRLRTDLMVRDRARYAATGGWGYGEWLDAPAADGGTGVRVNTVVAANPGKICHACHERLAAPGYVFSARK